MPGPYFINDPDIDLATLDTDGSLAANSDTRIATQKAVKTYVDDCVEGEVTAVTATAPIASSGGSAPVISILPATTSDPGSMSAADKTILDALSGPTYITKTANSTLSAEFALGSLATGLLKNTTITGTPTIAAAGTDFVAPNGSITGATKTKITYDTKGLITAGADATTADFADSSNKRFVTDAQLAQIGSEAFCIVCSDETTAITTGTAKVTFRAPFAFTVTAVRASLTTGSSSGIPTIDINEAGTTILSTKLTIDANELTSVTAATQAVISDSAIANDAQITIDIDVAGTGAAGLKVWILAQK